MTGPTALLALAMGPAAGSDARRAALRELSRPEYHRDDPSLVRRAISWLLSQLDRLGGASTGVSALGVLVVVIVVGVVFVLVRSGRPGRRAAAGMAGVDPLLSLGHSDHARAAQEFTDAGRYALALREWLRATVGTLADRGVLDPRPGRTADDIARAAGAQLPDAASALLAVAGAFDAVWFGGRTATAADAEAGRVAAAAVHSAPIRAGRVDERQYALPR